MPDQAGLRRRASAARFSLTMRRLSALANVPVGMAEVHAPVAAGGAAQHAHLRSVRGEDPGVTGSALPHQAVGPYPRILDTGCDYAAVGSVAVLPVS